MTEQDSIIKDIPLTDAELKLRFEGKKQVTEPDNEIQAYCFSMINQFTEKEMSGINIKAGYTENIVNYRGNIGFTVYEEFRGMHYSARSCLLLIPTYYHVCAFWLRPMTATCRNKIKKRSKIWSKKN